MKNKKIEKKCEAMLYAWSDLVAELREKHDKNIHFKLSFDSYGADTGNSHFDRFYCGKDGLLKNGGNSVSHLQNIIKELQHLIGEPEYKQGDLMVSSSDSVYMLTEDDNRDMGVGLRMGITSPCQRGYHGERFCGGPKYTGELVIEQLDDGKDPKQGDLIIYNDGDVMMVVDWDKGRNLFSYTGIFIHRDCDDSDDERGEYGDGWSKRWFNPKKLHGKITLTQNDCIVEEYEKPTARSLEDRIKQLEADNEKLRKDGYLG